MKDLLDIRKEIDAIDDRIVELYEERMQLAEDVAEYKFLNHKPVFDKEREKSKLEALEAKTHSDFNRYGVKELFDQIMSMSRKKQYQLLTGHGIIQESQFTCIGEPDFKSAKVVFQGVEGAYSQQAMQEYFGKDCDSFHVETWKDAMEAIKNGYADYAVLPIENSSAGIVSENYDLLVEYDNYIVAEQIIKIDHVLVGCADAKLSDIKTIYSHPQALMQCSDYLEAHRDWEKISLKNTAMAAKKVKDDQDRSQAAIAGRITADLYGLHVMDEAIQNEKNNSTRFIIVSGKKIYRKSANKISICFEIPHESGSLYHMLSHFIYNGLNMTNIQSRPIQGKNWEYRFFIDFEGTFEDDAVQNALRGLSEETTSLKVLGTF